MRSCVICSSCGICIWHLVTISVISKENVKFHFWRIFFHKRGGKSEGVPPNLLEVYLKTISAKRRRRGGRGGDSILDGNSLVHLITCYRTRVRSLTMLVTHWLTNWLTHSLLFSKLDWCDVWLVGITTQKLLRLLLLLMLMIRKVWTTVLCRFGSWSLVINLKKKIDFEHKVWGRVWSWSSSKI